MKKKILLVVMLLGFVLIFYKNNQIANYFCKLGDYCNSLNIDSNVLIDNNMNIFSGEIQYTTGVKIYESVWLYEDVEENNRLYEQFKIQGELCNDTDYGIGGGRGCSNVTGYIHTYAISGFGLQIEVYQNAMPNSVDNPGMFKSIIQQPFIVSGTNIQEIRISGTTIEEYNLQYHDMNDSDTIEIILSNDAKLLGYTGDVNLVETGIYNIFYQLGEEYFSKNYYFQTGKNYYYTYSSPGLSCIPGPCGFDKHKVIYFLK